MGFDKAANPDVVATLRVAVERINAVPLQPEFLLHTGDISHLSKFTEFDTVDQVLREAKARQVFYVPGEHDVPRRRRQAVSRALRQGHPGRGLVQLRSLGCAFYRPGECAQPQGRRARQSGRGALGGEQLEWLEDDVKGLPASTPIVVFAHIPLGTIYADWGWGTDDSAQALSYLRRFGSVTVLNGHIHQIMQKVEGNITFHTATSTAFPQPRPGTAPSPGPMKVPAEQLRSLLGLTSVQ